MNSETKILFGIASITIIILLSIVTLLLLTQEHYMITQLEVDHIEGWTIYHKYGEMHINKFVLCVDRLEDYNLSKGDIIIVHYLYSILGGNTFLDIELKEDW